MSNRNQFWLNTIPEFHWEIIHPNGHVHEFIEKTSDDDNRDVAEARVRVLNRELAKSPQEQP